MRDEPKNPKQKKKTNGHRDSDDRLRDFPEWLQESAHISQDSDSERPTKVASTSRKQSICTHFPKDRNCDICLRTKITKALCRRRTGEAVRRAEKFGDLKTADHKVLHEEGESRNNHRYAVVVEDRATQWIQCCPCKTKTSPETENTKVPRAVTQTQVIYTDNSSESGTSREDLSWTHRTSAPHRSETGGVAERAVRRVKEGTSAVLLQSGLDEKWWADSMGCHCRLRNVQDLLADRKTPYESRFGEPFQGPVIPCGAMVEYHPISARDLSTIHQFGKKILPGICLGYGLIAVPHAARALGALERQRGREIPYIPKNERERQRAFDEQFAIRTRVAKLG